MSDRQDGQVLSVTKGPAPGDQFSQSPAKTPGMQPSATRPTTHGKKSSTAEGTAASTPGMRTSPTRPTTRGKKR